MTGFLQLLISGIMVGSIYGLLALGFVLIYKSSHIFNFAIGAMLMLSAYIAYSMMSGFGLPYWLAVILTIIISMAIGALFERWPLRPLVGQPILAIIMVTIAIASLISGLSGALWGKALVRGFPTDFLSAKSIHFGGFVISQQRLWAFVICILLTGLLAVFFRKTRTGLNMRATADGHKLAQSTGIKVNSVIRNAWMIAAFVCAAGGMLLGAMRGITPDLADVAMKALPAALVGGLESLPGAIIGGIIIGVVESMLSGYVGGGIGEIGAFIVVILVLIVRPYGLGGLEIIERV